MKITFGRVMTYIIVTLFLFFAVVYALDKYSEHRQGIECGEGMMFDQPFQFSTQKVEEIDGAKVYVVNKKNGKVIDSTSIKLRTYNGSSVKYDLPYMYEFLKPMPTSANWEIRLVGSGRTVLVSNIETIWAEYNNSIGGSIHRCEVFTWKIDGRLYTTQEYHYFLN